MKSAIIGLGLTVALCAVAAPESWTPCGWGGGGFYWCAAFHPTQDGVIYMAGDVNGVYKSEDHGRNWRIVNHGLANYGVYSLAVNRCHPDTVYAATQDGLCKSVDAGKHWELLPRTGPKELRLTGERKKSIRAVAVDPSDSNVVYVASPAGKVFKSTDGGRTWSVVYEEPVNGTIYSVAVAAKQPSLVLAATETSGVLISEDAGRTWRAGSTPKKVASVAIAESDANIIFAACFTDGVWKSTDQGRTWTVVSEGLAKDCSILEVAISPANPSDVCVIGKADWNGRFYASHDGGLTWIESSQLAVDHAGNPTVLQGGNSAKTRLSAPTNLAVNPHNPQELFISANWRPCWSDDGGRTWTERDRGADISCVHDIRFHGGRAYVAAMDEGAFYSDDNGNRWHQIAPNKHDPSLNGHCWRIAATDQQGVDRIIATFSPWWQKYPGRVVISEDAGKSYQVVTNGLPDYVPKANTMWGIGHAHALAVDPRDARIVYLGMDGDPKGGNAGGGIFKSEDGGRAWRQLPHQPGSRRVFYGLVVDPTNSRRLYWGACGVGGGLYRSDDGGESWQLVFKNETWVFNVLVTGDGTVYCPGRNLWRSADHGKSWKQLTKFSGNGIIVGLECDPKNAKRLWHSVTFWNDSAQGGVFKTNDGGVTWQEITGDLPYRKPLILRFNPSTKELWAGGVGLHRLTQPSDK